MVQTSSSPDSPADSGLTDLFASARIEPVLSSSAGETSGRVPSPAPSSSSAGESPVSSFVKNLDAVAYGGVPLSSQQDAKKENVKFPDPFQDRKLSAMNFPSPFKVSSDLVFVFEPSSLCGSNVGQTGEKWCAVAGPKCEATGPKSHQLSNKFDELQPGLFIRVPSGDPDKIIAYTEPFIPLSKLTPKMVESYLSSSEERTPTDWRKEFSFMLDSDPEGAEEERLERKCAMQNLRSAVTPAPSTQKNGIVGLARCRRRYGLS